MCRVGAGLRNRVCVSAQKCTWYDVYLWRITEAMCCTEGVIEVYKSWCRNIIVTACEKAVLLPRG